MNSPSDCVCPANVPQCPKCGRKWEFFIQFGHDRVYTSAEVKDRFIALYGKPKHPFQPT